VAFLERVQGLLDEQQELGLSRSPRVLAGSQGAEVIIEGRRVLCLCSNNYLGLATEPSIAAAAARAVAELGFGACASRHITGSMELHVKAEARLARFLGSPAALLFSSGYLANLGLIQALSHRDTLIYSDSLNHASIVDGCRLSRAEVHVYPHADLEALARMLERTRAEGSSALVVTESLFSMDGDLAPLGGLRELCDQFDCGLVVDEAHAVGVLGPHGRGLCAELGIRADALVGTLGKAFGGSGAFIAGSREVVQAVENRARPYIFSTAPSPGLAAAALRATDLVEGADDARTALQRNAARLRGALRRLGFNVPTGASPIIPVLIGQPADTMRLSHQLLERGVFVHGVRPPTVAPGTSRLRVTPMAIHRADQLDFALDAFSSVRADP
jgi:glycine C-acetyltransferase